MLLSPWRTRRNRSKLIFQLYRSETVRNSQRAVCAYAQDFLAEDPPSPPRFEEPQPQAEAAQEDAEHAEHAEQAEQAEQEEHEARTRNCDRPALSECDCRERIKV